MRKAAGLLLLWVACGNGGDDKKPAPAKDTSQAAGVVTSSAGSAPAAAAPGADAGASAAPASQPAAPAAPASAPAAAAAPPPPPSTGGGTGTHPTPAGASGDDLGKQAIALYRVAACGGDDKERGAEGGKRGAAAALSKMDARLVAEHCRELSERYDRYRKRWVDKAVPYIEALRPTDVPKVVIYPFGGGDLTSALATYPDATEYTTMSLEPAGDVRSIDAISPKKLKGELELNRKNLIKFFAVSHSRTDNLGVESHGALPGELVFTMAALAVHGYEPVALRYFDFNDDGSLKYLTTKELDERVRELRGKKKSNAAIVNQVFGRAEIVFKKAHDAKAPHKILRHIAGNLDNDHFPGSPLERHLLSKGRVSAMTKAGSHLLWSTKHFSALRDYLLGHMEWMISDSTGIPPAYATPAGFVQDTYGIFKGPSSFGTWDKKNGKDFVALFQKNPQKKLPFYYGYPDNAHHGHMIITHKPGH